MFAVQNADQIVVGHVLGATALGYYALAFNLSSWPLTMFSMPIRTVAPALFSRLQHDKSAMRTSFLACLGLVGSVTLPVCLLISGAAVPLVHLVYGTRWTPAAQALVWLGGLAAIRILFEYIYDFFVVLARTRVVFTVQLVWLLVLIPALIVGTWAFGISGTAMAEVAVGLCIVLPWYAGELNRVGITRRALVGRLWLPLLAALAVGIAAYAVANVIPQAFAACAVSGLMALAVIALLVLSMRRVVSALRATLREPGVSEALPASAMAGVDEAEAFRQAALPDPAVRRWMAITRPDMRIPPRQQPLPPQRPVPPRRQPVPPWRPIPSPQASMQAGRRMPPSPQHPLPPRAVPQGQPLPPRRPIPPSPRHPLPPGRPIPSPQRGLSPRPVPQGQSLSPGRPLPPGRPMPSPWQPQPSVRRPQEAAPFPVPAGTSGGSSLSAEGRRFAAALAETRPMPRIRDITGPLEMYRDPTCGHPSTSRLSMRRGWIPQP